MKEDPRELCRLDQAAERLGISVAEVLGLIARGELPAVTFMEDRRNRDDDLSPRDDSFLRGERWFVDVTDLDAFARKVGKRDARRYGRGRRGAEFLQLAGRLRDAIF